MTKGCNIWMICLKLNWFLYGLSRMLQFSQFVWTPCYSVWDVLNNFLLIDATDRNKISSDQKRFFIALSLYPLTFFANTPFKEPRRKQFFVLCVHKVQKYIKYIKVHKVVYECSILVTWYRQRHVNTMNTTLHYHWWEFWWPNNGL